MGIKTLLAFILLIGSHLAVKSQTPIQTDRPDQTECPFIVPEKYVQIETGFTYENTADHVTNIAQPSVLWKYGVAKNIEFRLITELVCEKIFSKTQRGVAPVTVGFKVNIREEKGILPTASFIGHLTVSDLSSKNLKTTYYAPAFRFTMQHTLSYKISLGYNLGAEWDGETPEPTFIYTLTTGFSLTEKIGSYIEVYGFAPQKIKIDHRLDAGFTYLFNNNVMADISGGIGITENAPKNYGAIGFSFQYKIAFGILTQLQLKTNLILPEQKLNKMNRTYCWKCVIMLASVLGMIQAFS